jgi:hypothetical protein
MEKKMLSNFTILVKGKKDWVTQEDDFEIKVTGYDPDLRAGIIKAMKKNTTLATLVIEAADYFRENSENFEYNKN